MYENRALSTPLNTHSSRKKNVCNINHKFSQCRTHKAPMLRFVVSFFALLLFFSFFFTSKEKKHSEAEILICAEDGNFPWKFVHIFSCSYIDLYNFHSMLHITTEDSNRSESRSYTFCFIIISLLLASYFTFPREEQMGECVKFMEHKTLLENFRNFLTMRISTFLLIWRDEILWLWWKRNKYVARLIFFHKNSIKTSPWRKQEENS